MTVSIWLDETNRPIVYKNARSFYTKGPYSVVYTSDGLVHKYPTAKIWRVVESNYSPSEFELERSDTHK